MQFFFSFQNFNFSLMSQLADALYKIQLKTRKHKIKQSFNIKQSKEREYSLIKRTSHQRRAGNSNFPLRFTCIVFKIPDQNDTQQLLRSCPNSDDQSHGEAMLHALNPRVLDYNLKCLINECRHCFHYINIVYWELFLLISALNEMHQCNSAWGTTFASSLICHT